MPSKHECCECMQVLSLEASLSAVHSEHSQSDSSLKGRMQELLSELHSTLQVRFELKMHHATPYMSCAAVHETWTRYLTEWLHHELLAMSRAALINIASMKDAE